MPQTLLESFEIDQEKRALERFKAQHPEFFRKDDKKLAEHLFCVTSLLLVCTSLAIAIPVFGFKILFGMGSAFCWFCLINVTIHHHQTHRNAASSTKMKKNLEIIFLAALPNAPKRRQRYTRAHLNHHLRPFHETDVDHHYGTRLFLEKIKNPWTGFLYFLELTFIGGHVPGWEDDRYMNEIPLEKWNQKDYEAVKQREKKVAMKTASLQWGGFLTAACVLPYFGIGVRILPAMAWGWAFPMLLVKNWAHFLGQFQHYDADFLKEEVSLNRRTKSFHVPGWLNYLAGGEISGHFLHHLYPEMPYYHVEAARQEFIKNPELAKNFLIY